MLNHSRSNFANKVYTLFYLKKYLQVQGLKESFKENQGLLNRKFDFPVSVIGGKSFWKWSALKSYKYQRRGKK